MNSDAAPIERRDRKAFNKPHLEPEQLLEKLRRQNMTAAAETALPYLTQVGGYRMKGYWYHWQDPTTKRFRDGSNFDAVIERYEFDRELRRITGDALERIELMVRSTLSNVMSGHEGPHWFLKNELFTRSRSGADAVHGPRDSLMVRAAREVARMHRKPFIRHYVEHYDDPPLPPSWALCECLSFGTWSAAYPALANADYRKKIGRRFRVEDPDVLTSWLHAFSVMRNTVAHHGRLIGAQTGVTPREYRRRGLRFDKPQARTFFVVATVINYVCQGIHRGPRWKADLQAIFAKYPNVPIFGGLGFPTDWQDRPGWR